jgi:hypothetical protein
MEFIEKPSKTKLISAALDYFSYNPGALVVGIRTKEGREFFYKRNSQGGLPQKISKGRALNP